MSAMHRIAVILSIIGLTAVYFTHRLIERPKLIIGQETIVVHTLDKELDSPLPQYKAENLEEPKKLNIDCPPGYYPKSIWLDGVGSHPTRDFLLCMDAYLARGKPYVLLKPREGKSYMYVRVSLICDSTPNSSADSTGANMDSRCDFPSWNRGSAAGR